MPDPSKPPQPLDGIDPTDLTDYDELSRWAESDAGADAIAAALNTPMTEAERAHQREHLAIVDAIIANSTNDDNPPEHHTHADTGHAQRPDCGRK